MKRLLLVVLILFPFSLTAQTPFSGDSARAYLQVIAEEIGPRPMGSPAERRAMGFALMKFKEFGLDDFYFMPMSEVPGDGERKPWNTNSGIAVGIKRGLSDSIIVLGAHIDSATPEVPGANDDGSGSAVVIELARVLSKRTNHYTMVFCLFGGEEQGLRGSRHFANTFGAMDRVVLMLQADMANGSDWLIPMIDSYKKSTPEWLVSAAYEEMRALGYGTFSYPTHFFTLNYMTPQGGIGSDHQPFLERGIPAIDFTSDPTDNIHTPQDNLALFIPSGLKRSGDLMYRLVDRFDGNIPDRNTEPYYFLDVAQYPFFIPMWVVWAVIIISLAAAIVALIAVRRKRTEPNRDDRPRVPALKLFLIALIIQAGVWLSENVVSLLKGIRYPWITDLTGYVVLAFLGALIAIWVSLQFTPALRLSRDPYRWYLRTFVWLIVLTILTAFSGPRLMLYPAFALLFIALAMLARPAWLKLLLWLIAPHLLFRLAFNEVFPLFARSIILQSPLLDVLTSAILHAGLIVFFALWSFPILLGFAAVWRDLPHAAAYFRVFRGRQGILALGLVFAFCVGYLLFQPSYSEHWQQIVHVDQSLTLPDGTMKGFVRSSEYLNGGRVSAEGLDSGITDRSHVVKLAERTIPDSSWLEVNRLVTARLDGGYELSLRLRMKHRPYTLSVSYAGPKAVVNDASAPFATSTSERQFAMRWTAFPDAEMTIPIRFATQRPDSLTETIEAVFVQPIVPVAFTKDLTTTIYRTTVRRSDTLRAPF